MPQYLSPGVYVEEVPSAIKPIAGVSTSTAGFIGVVPDLLPMPPTLMKTKMIPKEQVDGTKTTFDLDDYPVVTAPNTYRIRINGQSVDAELKNAGGKSQIVFPTQQPTRRGTRGAGTVNAIQTNVDITVDYMVGPTVKVK